MLAERQVPWPCRVDVGTTVNMFGQLVHVVHLDGIGKREPACTQSTPREESLEVAFHVLAVGDGRDLAATRLRLVPEEQVLAAQVAALAAEAALHGLGKKILERRNAEPAADPLGVMLFEMKAYLAESDARAALLPRSVLLDLVSVIEVQSAHVEALEVQAEAAFVQLEATFATLIAEAPDDTVVVMVDGTPVTVKEMLGHIQDGDSVAVEYMSYLRRHLVEMLRPQQEAPPSRMEIGTAVAVHALQRSAVGETGPEWTVERGEWEALNLLRTALGWPTIPPHDHPTPTTLALPEHLVLRFASVLAESDPK